MKKLIAIALLIVVPMAGAADYNKPMAKKFRNASYSELVAMGKKVNKLFSNEVPIYIDEITQTVGIQFVAMNRTVNYVNRVDFEHYDLSYSDVEGMLGEFKKIAKNELVVSNCSIPDKRTMLEGNIKFDYTYVDQNGKFLFDFTTTKSDCD